MDRQARPAGRRHPQRDARRRPDAVAGEGRQDLKLTRAGFLRLAAGSGAASLLAGAGAHLTDLLAHAEAASGTPRARLTTVRTVLPIVQRGLPTQVLDVRDFGAACDDATDDSTAVQAALDAVPAGGATVLIPRGLRCLVGSLLVKRDGTWVVSGDGGGLHGKRNNIRILSTNGRNDVVFQDLRVVGTGKDDGGSSSGRGALHVADGSQRCQVLNCVVEKANGTGIVDDGDGSLVSGNTVLETGEHGIYSSGSISSRYVGNYVRDAGKDCALTIPVVHGLRFSGSKGCTASGNTILDTGRGTGVTGYGILFTDDATGCVASGNSVTHTQGNDVYVGTGHGCSVLNNTIVSNAAGFDSILTVGGGRNTIANNTIRREAANGSAIRWNTPHAEGADVVEANQITALVEHAASAPAIYVDTPTAAGVVIARNVIEPASSWSHGVDILAGATGTRVDSNSVAAAVPYTDAGTGTILVV